MTLKELAVELRKVIKFRYLAKDSVGTIYAYSGQKPEYSEKDEFWMCNFSRTSVVFELWSYAVSLDLSEYMDDQGNIDYSKCIVEVE